jgi:2-hydroxymuconate-semialdehyde hydrolase
MSVGLQPRERAAGPRERLLAGTAATERRLRLAGVSTAVLEAGDGPPLVLLHGGIECGGAVWAPVIPLLAESRRVVVPDLPGLGASEPLARLDDAAFAAWLGELLDETCPESPALVAHSLGGSLAARFAVEHGALIRRLVLCSAPAVGPYRMPLRLRALAVRFGVRPTAPNLERFARFALLDLDRTRERDPEWLDAFVSYTLARARVGHVKRTMRGLVGSGTRRVDDADLRRIPVPAALAWGRHDRMTPIGLADGAARRLGWPLHVIDDAAHVPQLEQPDAFVDTIIRQ